MNIQSRKKIIQSDPLPENFKSLEEFREFWDTHSSADYEDLMEDVNVQVDLSRSKRYYPVAKDLITQLKTQAHQQGISTETLINLWLKEKIIETAKRKEKIVATIQIIFSRQKNERQKNDVGHDDADGMETEFSIIKAILTVQRLAGYKHFSVLHLFVF